MRPTILDFVPERLIEAREARSMTQAALADLLGVKAQAVSAYERSKSAPSRHMLHAISHRTRFPEQRFLTPMPEHPVGVPYFRSLASATKRARLRAQRRLGWLRHDICGFLDRYIEFPSVEFPLFDVPSNPESLNRDDVEKIATELRRAWGLGDGPISDLVLLLENHGAVVVRQELGANTLDAFSEVDATSGRPFIVLGTEKASACRSRFDAAHELGHIVLHRRVSKHIANGSSMYKLIEKQAHHFATAFLLPRESFADEFGAPSLDAMVILKSRWRVSVAAMIQRALNIGLIDEYRVQRLYANKNRRWGKYAEPLDKEIEAEQPRFIRRSFDLLLDRGLTSRPEIETALSMHIHDVESAAGLEHGFFGDDSPNYKFPMLKDDDRPRDVDTPSLPFSRSDDPSASEQSPPCELSLDAARG